MLGLLVPRRLVWSLVIGGEVLQKACSTFEIEARAGIFLGRIHGGSRKLIHSVVGSLVLDLLLPRRMVWSLVVGGEVLKKTCSTFGIGALAGIFLRRIHGGNLRVIE